MDSNTPNTMQAWTHTTRGHPSSVLSLTTVPIPTITSPHQILVRISHAALNPGASIILHLVPFLFRSTPSIPEMDFSGYVVSVGSSVPALRNLVPGARVFGSIPVGQHVRTTSGALAEYTVVDHSAVCRAPEGIEMEALAGLGIAGATALELVKAAKLKKGDSVLINGASGGVGHLVLQIARAKVGASGRVAAICSTRNVDWVAQLGADEVTDYMIHEPVATRLVTKYEDSKFNAVIDAVGIQGLFNACPGFLAEGKPYVSIGPKAKSYTYWGLFSTIGIMMNNFMWPQILGGVPRNYVQVTGIANQEAMKGMRRMVEEGSVRVHVGTMVDFKDAQEAYEKMLSGHSQGKIVVKVREEDHILSSD